MHGIHVATSKEEVLIKLGADNLNVNQNNFASQLNREIRENPLGMSREAIVGARSSGGRLKSRGPDFFPNKS